MMGHRVRGWANMNPTKTLYKLLSQIKSWILIFLDTFLKTQLSDLAVSAVILDMFIRTGLVYRNVNRFPHTAPLFPQNRTQIQAK